MIKVSTYSRREEAKPAGEYDIHRFHGFTKPRLLKVILPCL